MVTHILPLTYRPKIQPVLNGEIRGTIRRQPKHRTYAPGDTLLLHGREGGRFSKWTWRLYLDIYKAYHLFVFSDGILDKFNTFHKWDHPLVNDLARLDGIVPENGRTHGEELGVFLNKTYSLENSSTGKGTDFVNIRWSWPPKMFVDANGKIHYIG